MHPPDRRCNTMRARVYSSGCAFLVAIAAAAARVGARVTSAVANACQSPVSRCVCQSLHLAKRAYHPHTCRRVGMVSRARRHLGPAIRYRARPPVCDASQTRLGRALATRRQDGGICLGCRAAALPRRRVCWLRLGHSNAAPPATSSSSSPPVAPRAPAHRHQRDDPLLRSRMPAP